jgi:hypothetical protein
LAHFPDISTRIGILDIVMVGNVLEFADALSRSYYTGKAEKGIPEEENVARWRYRQLMKWYSTKYVLKFDKSYVNPWYLVYLSIVRFASTLCAYVTRWRSNLEEGVSPVKFRTAVSNHLRRNWSALIPKYESLAQNAPRSFAWSGPDFEVVPRGKLPRDVIELKDLENERVFVEEEGTRESELTDLDSIRASNDKGPDEEQPQDDDKMDVDNDGRDDNSKNGAKEDSVGSQPVAGGMVTRSKRRPRSESSGKSGEDTQHMLSNPLLFLQLNRQLNAKERENDKTIFCH